MPSSSAGRTLRLNSPGSASTELSPFWARTNFASRWKSRKIWHGRMEACLIPGQLGTYAFYYNIAALQSLLTNDTSGAVVFAEKAFTLAAETGSASTEAMSRIVLSQAVYETGDHGSAAKELAEGEAFIRQMGSQLFEFTCGLVKAYFAFGRGDERAGLEALADALSLGRRKGYAYAPMLWRPPVWSLLCAKALGAGIEVAYVRYLVRRQALYPEILPVEVEHWPWPVRIYTLGKFELYLAEKAISMYAGSFLSGESGQQWILPFREHLMYRFCRLVSSYGKHLERSQKWDQAEECYRKALVFDDLVDEEIYQKLMALYWRNGQSDRAIEVYRRLCRTLSAALGIKPSPKTEAIYNSLIRHSDPKPPDAVS